MMRQRFRLGRGRIGETIEQDFGDTAMQNLAPALEQVLIGRVLDQRMFEPIVGLRRQALDQQDVGVGSAEWSRRFARRAP
jgi:hypothetical protein